MATKKIAKPRTKPKREPVDVPVPPTFEELRRVVAARAQLEAKLTIAKNVEMATVIAMIDSGKYRVADVARELGMSRQNLYKKIGRKEP